MQTCLPPYSTYAHARARYGTSMRPSATYRPCAFVLTSTTPVVSAGRIHTLAPAIGLPCVSTAVPVTVRAWVVGVWLGGTWPAVEPPPPAAVDCPGADSATLYPPVSPTYALVTMIVN